MVLCFFYTNAAAQQDEIDSLRYEIEELKTKLFELEARLNKLRLKRKTIKEGNAEKSKPYMIIENWRKLKIGMKQRDVKKILGEPTRVSAGRYSYIWWYEWVEKRYRIGHVSFDNNKKIVLWVEP